MEPTIPWYKSAIVRQQIVMIIVGLLGVFKIATDIDIDATVAAIFAGIAAVVPIWTLITRLYKPTPPVTETAVVKTVEFKEKQVAAAKESTFAEDLRKGPNQKGLVRMSVLLGLLAIGAAAVPMASCSNTPAAYRAAKECDDAVSCYAYAVTEHYAALVKQAANLRERPSTPPEVVETLQDTDSIVYPFIEKLRTAKDSYLEVKNAENQKELQEAIDRAIVELSRLLQALDQAQKVVS